VTYSNTRK